MTYLVAAYAAIWCLLVIYIFSLRSRQRNLEKALEALQQRVEKL